MSELGIGLYKIFQSIKEKNLGIIFDTSGSMYQYLDVVRNSIIKLTHYLSHTSNNSQFNVISFSKTNSSFAESVVPCTKENIYSLSRWLENLNCETQTNSLLALVSAFSDENCDGVVIFTDGLPSQKTGVVSKCVEEISDGRPVHVIYVNNGFNDRNVINFWEILTESTYGTFHIIQHTKKDEQFAIYSKGSQEYDVYSHSEFSSEGSTSVGYDFKKNMKKLQSRPDLNNAIKRYVGRTVLAKSKEDSLFYKGAVLEEKSGGVFVYFGDDGTRNFVKLEDVIFYDEENPEKVYDGDFVLANFNKNVFIPGKVIKKEYIYDETDDSLDFIRMLKVLSFNERNQVVSMNRVIRITEEQYNRFVREILRKQIAKADENIGKLEESKVELFRTKSYDPDTYWEQEEQNDYLKEKIENQLAESASFLRNLTIGKDLNTYLSDETMAVVGEMRRDRLSQSLCLPKKNLGSTGDSSFLLNKSYTHVKPPMAPRIKSWSNSDEIDSKRKQRRIRSASVGANAVERSKKHWIGRPITKEALPKRPLNENNGRYHVVKSKTNRPVAEDYQTTDGVPFPPRSDKKFHQHQTGTWSTTQRSVPVYQHQDIIGHRVVDVYNKPFNQRIGHADKKAEICEQKRIDSLRVAQERRKEKTLARKKELEQQKQERDKQARTQKKERDEEGYTKIKITIEKDRSLRENKQKKIDYWRNFETQREAKNQQQKYERIDAMREKKMNYPQLKDEKPVQMNQHQKVREEKQKKCEESRLEKEIVKHEAKLERLRKLRKSTDARFDSLRKKNDSHRDITEHVKNLNTGRTRAEILP